MVRDAVCDVCLEETRYASVFYQGGSRDEVMLCLACRDAYQLSTGTGAVSWQGFSTRLHINRTRQFYEYKTRILDALGCV